jgi:5-methylcytosine-specific restriction endonuclease McrA
MKHVELICELMLSIQKGDPINKKTALNSIMADAGVDMRQVKRGSRLTILALNRIRKMFPKLYTTRFIKVTDFYTLATLIAKFEQEGLILADKRRNRLAWDILTVFSNKVDDLREKLKKAQNLGAEQDLYRQSVLTVMQATDEVNQRRLRESVVRGLLESLFAKKDAQRGFSDAQRRILWNTSADRRCPKCKKRLLWEDFTIDHIDPYSKGGRSRLENAALMCRSCNSAKGKR